MIVNEEEMDGTCRTHWRDEKMLTKFRSRTWRKETTWET